MTLWIIMILWIKHRGHDKEIRISLSIFWDIVVQGGNEVKRYLSLYFSMVQLDNN